MKDPGSFQGVLSFALPEIFIFYISFAELRFYFVFESFLSVSSLTGKKQKLFIQ